MQHYVNTQNLTDLDKTGYASYKSKKGNFCFTLWSSGKRHRAVWHGTDCDVADIKILKAAGTYTILLAVKRLSADSHVYKKSGFCV